MKDRPYLFANELREWANAKPNPFKGKISGWVLPKPSFAKYVGWGEYAITNARGRRKALMTFGMSTCVAVGLYDQSSQTVAVGHFMEQNDPQSLQTMIDDVAQGKVDKSSIRAYIRGAGWTGHSSLATELLRVIYNNGLNLRGAAIEDHDNTLYNGFSLNARRGRLRANLAPKFGRNRYIPQKGGTPIKRTFDGRR